MESIFNINNWERLLSDQEVLNSFLAGALMTLKVSFWGMITALVLGIISGFMSSSRNSVLKGISRFYVEFFQNTPLVLQVFFYYYSFPTLRRIISKSWFNKTITRRQARFSPEFYGILGVGLYHGAYISEVVRTGIESVPKGQLEAARSQGFSTFQASVFIILPQTMRMILPPLANQALNLVKNSSVIALIGGFDIMYYSNRYVGKTSNLCGYVLCAAMYFIICFPIARLVKYLETRSNTTPGSRRKNRRASVEVTD